MPPYANTRSSRRRSRDGMKRGTAGATAQRLPLFTADESWSRANGARDDAPERDDYGFMLEPGFWLTILFACLPIAAGCVYLLLTEG
jgi:hypothetical protein